MPVIRRHRVAPVFALVVATVLAGCGGSPAPTTAQWVERADAICRAAQEELDRQPPSQSPFPGEPLRQAADATATELDALKKLRKPEDKGRVEDYLVTLRLRNDALRDYADKTDKAPAAGPQVPVDQLLDLTGKAADQAKALGLTACGAGVDPSVGYGPTASTTSIPAPPPGEGPTLSPDEANTVDEPG